MLLYATLKDRETQEYTVINQIESEKLGFEQVDLDCINGKFYKTGVGEPISEKQKHIRSVRDSYLKLFVDPVQSLPLKWDELTTEEQNEYAEYRRYLLDYTDTAYWYEKEPQTFEEWSK